MKHQHAKLALALFGCAFILAGCPRFAYIELHNATDNDVAVYMAGEHKGTAERNETLRFRAGSRDLEIQSNDQVWAYSFVVPHGGEDGPYFDGTLWLRLKDNGVLEALPTTYEGKDEVPSKQPEAFPIYPDLPNKGFNRTPESNGPAKPGKSGGGAG